MDVYLGLTRRAYILTLEICPAPFDVSIGPSPVDPLLSLPSRWSPPRPEHLAGYLSVTCRSQLLAHFFSARSDRYPRAANGERGQRPRITTFRPVDSQLGHFKRVARTCSLVILESIYNADIASRHWVMMTFEPGDTGAQSSVEVVGHTYIRCTVRGRGGWGSGWYGDGNGTPRNVSYQIQPPPCAPHDNCSCPAASSPRRRPGHHRHLF